MRLLAAIDEHGSITEGARVMGVPYRVAWQKVHEMEERLGERLLATQTGGRKGAGPTSPRPAGSTWRGMQAFCDRTDEAIRRIYLDTFGAPPGA